MTIAIAILAAGRASRFGGGKLDAACASKPLGRWVLDAVAAAGAPPGMLIVGPDAPAFTHDASANGWTLITNLYPDEGLGGSVTLAARHANGLRADALVLLLADMPLVDKKMIGALLNHQPVMDPVATRYPNDRPGVPARFPASMFSDLAQLSGDRGAAALLIDRPDLHLIDPPSGALTDVDDPDSLARAESLLSKSNSGSSTTADWLT